MLRATAVAALCWGATVVTFRAAGTPGSPQGTEFDQLLVQHRRDISTPAGKAYEDAFMAHYQTNFGAVLGACIQKSGPPTSFEVIYVVDKDGHVTKGVAKAPTTLTACVVEAAQRDTFPKPPFSPFHQHIIQNFGP